MCEQAGWSELDVRAVDTVRLLAADAVQKVGNGHPGTAMSLAPLAYLLFQQVMRHDPANDQWLGRDRFVLSAGHSSLTLYLQLYLSGYGLELSDLQALRTWGSATPGHPEYRHTRGVEITTGPLGQGLASAVGLAMGARRERGLLDPDAAAGTSPFDHHVYVIASDGDLMEGLTAEASSLAGHQQLGALIVFYDSNHISIEDDTDISFSEDVAVVGRLLVQGRDAVSQIVGPVRCQLQACGALPVAELLLGLRRLGPGRPALTGRQLAVGQLPAGAAHPGRPSGPNLAGAAGTGPGGAARLLHRPGGHPASWGAARPAAGGGLHRGQRRVRVGGLSVAAPGRPGLVPPGLRPERRRSSGAAAIDHVGRATSGRVLQGDCAAVSAGGRHHCHAGACQTSTGTLGRAGGTAGAAGCCTASRPGTTRTSAATRW